MVPIAPSRIRILFSSSERKSILTALLLPSLKNQKWPPQKKAASPGYPPLICQDLGLAGIGTFPLRGLPGFIGPVPPPLWIRV